MQFVCLLDSLIEFRSEDGDTGGCRLLLKETDAATRNVTQTGPQGVQLRLQFLDKESDFKLA